MMLDSCSNASMDSMVSLLCCAISAGLGFITLMLCYQSQSWFRHIDAVLQCRAPLSPSGHLQRCVTAASQCRCHEGTPPASSLPHACQASVTWLCMCFLPAATYCAHPALLAAACRMASRSSRSCQAAWQQLCQGLWRMSAWAHKGLKTARPMTWSNWKSACRCKQQYGCLCDSRFSRCFRCWTALWRSTPHCPLPRLLLW